MGKNGCNIGKLTQVTSPYLTCIEHDIITPKVKVKGYQNRLHQTMAARACSSVGDDFESAMPIEVCGSNNDSKHDVTLLQ